MSDTQAKQRPGLFQVMREQMRVRYLSLFTEKNYILWVRRFIHFHKGPHPREMGAAEITQFLRDLATNKQISAATQNQALTAG